MSIAAVGSGTSNPYTPQTKAVKPQQTQAKQQPAVKTDADGDKDGSTGSKGGQVDVKA